MISSTKKISLAAVSALALAAAMPALDALADEEREEYGHGLQASTQASPASSRPVDSLESLAGTAFAPLSAPVKYERRPDAAVSEEVEAPPAADATTSSDGQGDEGQLGVVMLEESEAARVESISSDGQGGFSVVFVVNGEETEVQFGPEDYTGSDYYKQTDDAEYYFWHAPIYADFKFVARQYFSLVGWTHGSGEFWPRGYSSYGVLTPAGRLVSLGSATYEGHVIADVWQNFTGPEQADIQGQLWGEMTLEADFSERTIYGDVDNLWYRPPEQQEWVRVPDSNSLIISTVYPTEVPAITDPMVPPDSPRTSGEIDGNRFHADWRGEDTNEPVTCLAIGCPPAFSSLGESVSGFEGSMLGAFYGPNGEEVGGVFTGGRAETNEVVNGRFGGESQRAAMAREWSKIVPGRDNGVSVSPGAAVYADSSDDTLANLLPDGDTTFAALSASVERSYADQRTSHPDSGGAYVRSISSDGANGFRVTYVVDGRESQVRLAAGDWSDDWGSFNVNRGPGGNDYWLWSWTDSMWSDPENRAGGSSEFDYFDINGWVAWTPGDGFEGFAVYGARTRPGALPEGSATYDGRVAAHIWDGDDPDYRTSRTRVHGDLMLEANFERSTISGRVDGIAVRPETANDWLSLGESNSLDISNGRIVGSWFDADWTGVDTNDGSVTCTAIGCPPAGDTIPEHSMRGFAGTMEGEFFGPNAEEVGGVLGGHRSATATTPEQYINGGFGAKQQD